MAIAKNRRKAQPLAPISTNSTMLRHLFNGTIFLAFTFGLNACNGQTNTDIQKEKVSESKKIPNRQLKFLKTQNSQPGDNVNCSLQDKVGNLWFGTTAEGLYKYDGKSFTQFTSTNGLNSNAIGSILEDKNGKIWIGTDAGISVYDGKTFTEIHIPLSKNMPANKISNKQHSVFDIKQDKSGQLWFATINGVFIYDGKSFTHFKISESEGGFLSSNHNIEKILVDNAGNIWFGGRTNKGVFRYDGKILTSLKHNGDDWAWPALHDNKGNIWFSSWQGAYRYDGKTFTKIEALSTRTISPITRIVEDKKGNLWFCGGGRGICRFDGKSYACFTTKDGLRNNDVWNIFEDKSGNIWIGSRNTELCMYDGKTFTCF